MKFARYLEETQTPEWKKAYIDYRGLKKRITAIRREAEGLDAINEGSSGEDPLLGGSRKDARKAGGSHGGPHLRKLPTHELSKSNSGEDTAESPPLPLSEEDGEDEASIAKSRIGSNQDEGGYEEDGESGGDQDEENTVSRERRASLKHSGRNLQIFESTTAASDEHTEQASRPSYSKPAASDSNVVKGAVSTSSDNPPAHTPSVAFSPPISRPNRGRSNTFASITSRFRLPSLSLQSPAGNTVPSINSGTTPAAPLSSHPGQTLPTDVGRIRSLHETMPTLTPAQKRFFEKLDSELDKIETFYLDREKESRERSAALKVQLQELKDHRKLFYEAHPPTHKGLISALSSFVPGVSQDRKDHIHAEWGNRLDAHRRKRSQSRARSQSQSRQKLPSSSRVASSEQSSGSERPQRQVGIMEAVGDRLRKVVDTTTAATAAAAGTTVAVFADGNDIHKLYHDFKGKGKDKYDPEEYTHAKKKLKKAVLEHYRGLEMLNDYRILNLTGFRKALKKFEKVANVRAQTAYMQEKVEPSAFASDDSVVSMIKETELLFAARFARGDKKKAMARLRGGWRVRKTHHFSTFRAGTLIGLALPAFIDGLVRSFQPETRAAIPGWDGLLYVYSVLFVPTVFACLIGLNLAVWSNSRINYVFIFELDVRTRLDHHEYVETPATLLTTLIYAFYFSFARVASDSVHPTSWPLIWLLFVAFLLFNPFPIFARSARWWLLRNWGKLLSSGVRRVEFADFWMGDQFCSLVFTLSNLWFLGCVYGHSDDGGLGTVALEDFEDLPSNHHKPRFGFDQHWARCTRSDYSPSLWVVPIILAMLPLLIRLVQSVRRWFDSRLITHLINGGKYGTGIVYYIVYYTWRHTGSHHHGAAFVLWILLGIVYAVYACTWDFLMDWSLFKPRARWPLLRNELLYSNHIWTYYFAIVTNLLIRFVWVIYIPASGPTFILRSFIAGLLEMLRRVQWNFIRLENEHLGNMDQYRVTREVPLPYSVDDLAQSDNEEDMDEDAMSERKSWRSRRNIRVAMDEQRQQEEPRGSREQEHHDA